MRLLALRTLFAAAIVLTIAAAGRAQSVDLHSEPQISPDGTGIIAQAWVYGDYSVDFYYTTTVNVALTRDEGEEGADCTFHSTGTGNVTVVCGAPYDSSFNYTVDGDIVITAYYEATLNDPYAFQYWNDLYYDGFGPYGPSSFYFSGSYPARNAGGGIFLGSVITFLQAFARERSGPPAHLHVIHDATITRTDLCNNAQKIIDFQIHDNGHHATGKTMIAERPWTMTDTCTNAQPNLSTTCSSNDVNSYGNFKDRLKTGCTGYGTYLGGSNCGFDFPDQWRWCATPSINIPIAWMYYGLGHTIINVDGQPDIEDGSEKFP